MRETNGVAWVQEFPATSPLTIRFFKAEYNADGND